MTDEHHREIARVSVRGKHGKQTLLPPSMPQGGCVWSPGTGPPSSAATSGHLDQRGLGMSLCLSGRFLETLRIQALSSSLPLCPVSLISMIPYLLAVWDAVAFTVVPPHCACLHSSYWENEGVVGAALWPSQGTASHPLLPVPTGLPRTERLQGEYGWVKDVNMFTGQRWRHLTFV